MSKTLQLLLMVWVVAVGSTVFIGCLVAMILTGDM